MRTPWWGAESSKLGQRRADRSGAALSGSPFDFSGDDDGRVDPVDVLAICVDDELLDALVSGRSVGSGYTCGFDAGMDAGYADDQRMLAILARWRSDVESEPFPELISIDGASAVIVAGRRTPRPGRRLMPVAAAVAVLAMSGVGVAAGNAQPGDPLWGVASMIDANRAKSMEAAYRVDLGLRTARQALAQGRVAEARAALASVAPELNQVQDQVRKDELSRRGGNLLRSADEAHEGEHMDTDESGARLDPNRRNHGGPRNSNEPSSQNSRGSSTDKNAPEPASEPGSDRQDTDKGKDSRPERKPAPDSGGPSPDSGQSAPRSGKPAPDSGGKSAPGSGGKPAPGSGKPAPDNGGDSGSGNTGKPSSDNGDRSGSGDTSTSGHG